MITITILNLFSPLIFFPALPFSSIYFQALIWLIDKILLGPCKTDNHETINTWYDHKHILKCMIIPVTLPHLLLLIYEFNRINFSLFLWKLARFLNCSVLREDHIQGTFTVNQLFITNRSLIQFLSCQCEPSKFHSGTRWEKHRFLCLVWSALVHGEFRHWLDINKETLLFCVIAYLPLIMNMKFLSNFEICLCFLLVIIVCHRSVSVLVWHTVLVLFL